jgi:hypothetical protein
MSFDSTILSFNLNNNFVIYYKVCNILMRQYCVFIIDFKSFLPFKFYSS